MDTNLVVLIALGVLGSGVLVALFRNRGQGEVRLVIDGRAFQFPQWAFTAITRGTTQAEVADIDAVGEWEVLEQRALRRLATIDKGDRAYRKQVKQALAEARRELATAREQAQVAYEDAGRRWLLSAAGQQWLQSRGLSFP